MPFDRLLFVALLAVQSLQGLEPDEIPGIPVTVSELQPLMTPEVNHRIAEVRRRYVAARNLAKRPSGNPEHRMIAQASLNYELGLFAIGKGPAAAADAAAYVTRLSPCL